jgi:tetratricopeptide (TPR) repeat protein
LSPSPPVQDLLDRYDRGAYQSVLDDIGRLDRNGDLPKRFEAEAPPWVASNRASVERRSLVAATLALELAHAPNLWTPGGLASPAQSSRVERRWKQDNAARIGLVLWGDDILQLHERSNGESLEAERQWYLTSIAGLEELQATWPILLGQPQVTDDPLLYPLQRRVGAGGYLTRIAVRLPVEPRLGLAGVQGQEQDETRCDRRFCFDELSPSVVPSLQKRANAAAPSIIRSFDDSFLAANKARAIQNQQAFAAIPRIVEAFARVATSDAVRAEAQIHIGYSYVRVMNWPVARAALTDVPRFTTEPFLLYLADYFTGRALEGMGDRDAAIAAYRRALEHAPNARSAATLLSAQLFLRDKPGDRQEAPALLDAVMKAGPRPDDPWASYWKGQARLWPEFMGHLREALR